MCLLERKNIYRSVNGHLAAMTAHHELILDPNIRDWVVLPMVLIMVLMGLSRTSVSFLLKSDKAAPDENEVQSKQTLGRAGKLRNAGNFLSPSAFYMRKNYFNNRENGALRKKVESTVNNPMMNPNGMADMMKGNMTFMVPNMLMMGLVSYFFQGFVLVKVPFPLTMRFKLMLQRGIDLTTLDVSYVSSLSWYFLVMFGLRGLFTLITGDNSMSDETKAMQMQMGMGMGQQQGFDAPKAFQAERRSLELHAHAWLLDGVERRLLGLADPVDTAAAAGAAAPAAAKGAAAAPAAASAKYRRRK